MFQKKEVELNFDIVIGPSSMIKGDLESEGSIRIDGKVIGNLKALGNVIISESAYVNGNIICHSLELHGTVEGNVKTQGRIHLRHHSKLTGDIESKSFNTDEGAEFCGNCIVNPNELLDIVIDPMIKETDFNKVESNLVDFKLSKENKKEAKEQNETKEMPKENAK